MTRDSSTDERARTALYAATLVASLGVGILVGRSACAPEPDVRVEEKVVERTVTETPDTSGLCPCPPDTGPPPGDAVAYEPPEPPDKDEQGLPDAGGPPDPAARQKLLAWVRDQSSDLTDCRPESLTDTRFGITLGFGDGPVVESVDINAPEENVSDDVLGCLKRRMRGWEPPASLTRGRESIFFGLRL